MVEEGSRNSEDAVLEPAKMVREGSIGVTGTLVSTLVRLDVGTAPSIMISVGLAVMISPPIDNVV